MKMFVKNLGSLLYSMGAPNLRIFWWFCDSIAISASISSGRNELQRKGNSILKNDGSVTFSQNLANLAVDVAEILSRFVTHSTRFSCFYRAAWNADAV